MAFPSITPLRVTEFEQSPADDVGRTVNGNPWIRERHSNRKHAILAVYLLTTAEWTSLITDYEANHSTSFSWTDERDSPTTSRTVYYAGRPTRVQPNLPDSLHNVTVRLLEA